MDEKNSERVLIVISLIPALFTWTDSAAFLSVEVSLIYTDVSEKVFHAFIQHSCCWGGFNPLALLPCSIFMGEQGAPRSRQQCSQSRISRQLVVLLHAGTHLEEPQGVIDTPAHEAASCT